MYPYLQLLHDSSKPKAILSFLREKRHGDTEKKQTKIEVKGS